MKHQSISTRAVHETGGGIAIFAALSLSAIFGCVALAVDMGSYYLERRTAQGVADLAAMNAASYPDTAETAAASSIQANGLRNVRDLVVTKGHYEPDKSIAAAQRFQPGIQPYNAVRVEFMRDASMYFSRIFRKTPLAMKVSAAAGIANPATFSVGTRLAALRGGAVNGALSALLGTTVDLSLMDYQSLLDTKVRIDSALNAISAEAGLKAVTYDQLLAANISMVTILGGLKRALDIDGNSSASYILGTLANQVRSSQAKLMLSKIIDVGIYGPLTVGQPQSGLGATTSVLDILKSSAMLANGNKQVSVNLQLNIPGVAKSTLTLAIGEPMQRSAWASVGQSGSLVSTAQLKLRLNVEVTGASALAGLTIRLPIYAEAAYADAKLANVSCDPRSSRKSATVAVKPGIGRVAIADVTDASLAQPDMWQSLPAARIVSSSLVQITGRAEVIVGNGNSTDLVFSGNDVDTGTIKQTDTSSFVGSLVTSVLGKLSLQVQVGGLSLLTPGALTAAVANQLGAVAQPLDDVLYEILTTLGIHLGEADVQVNGIRCGTASLVN